MRIPLLLALLVLTPTALALPWDAPLALDVTPYRVGDVLVHEMRSVWPAQTGEPDRVVETTTLVEGDAAARDMYGGTRSTLAFRADVRDAGAPPESFIALRCHRLAGGGDLVRADWLQQGDAVGQETIVEIGASGSSRASRTVEGGLLASFDEPRCTGAALPASTRLVEGETIPLALVRPFLADLPDLDVRSAPATRADFHGRPALAYRFALADALLAMPRDPSADAGVTAVLRGANATFVVAEGVPGVARVEREIIQEDGGQAYGYATVIELTAFATGDGEARPRPDGLVLPPRAPGATFAPLRADALPDAALGLPFPSAEAHRAALDDPRAGFASYLQAHPGARVRSAQFRASSGGVEGSDGVWSFQVDDGSLGYLVSVERRTSVAAAPLALALPMPVYDVSGGEIATSGAPLVDAPDAETVARLAAEALVEGARLRLVEYASVVRYDVGAHGHASVELVLSEIDPQDDAPQEGRQARISIEKGALLEIQDYALGERRAGALAVSPARLDAPSSVPALARLEPGVGLAVGALTALALLALVAKVALVPLYTRLRRSTLLRNPLRARIVELLRGEPGMRLREVDAALGCGIGATRHHLDLLVRHGYAVEIHEHGALAFYLAGHVTPEEARRHLALRDPTTRALHDLLRLEPGLSLRQASARLGVSAPSLLRHRRKLAREGLLPGQEAVVQH